MNLNVIKKSNYKHCNVLFYGTKIKEDTIVRPDCSVVCKPITKKFLDFPPTLVVEILSPSTALKDRYTKFSIYEKFGIKYYMIVDEEKNEIEIYSLVDSKYLLQPINSDSTFIFNLDDDCHIELLLNNIWE